MTVIRPNSVSGITSITAQANEINVFRSDGALAGLQLNGVNFNTTAGVSTFATLNVTTVSIGGTLTYEDVTNVDSVGIITARTGIKVLGGGINAVGVVTATSFSGSGANLTGVLKNIVEDTSPQLGANLDVNGSNILFPDSSSAGTNLNRLKFGTGNDLHIWHNSNTNNSNISAYSGDLYIQGNNGSGTGVNQIAIKSNAAVELNYQGTKKFETIGTGVKVSSSAVAHLKINSGNNSSAVIHFGNVADDDMAQIWYDDYANSMYFRTSTNTPMNFYTNNTSRLILQNDGHLRPYIADTYDLGTSSYRWRNVYTQDLQLSNEAKKDKGGNNVDGTWGDWTLQEGESNVYMINNRSGKKFKLKMEEV